MTKRVLLKRMIHQLHWPSVFYGLLATALLAVMVVVGSRNLADFDAALVGYTFACLFAFFSSLIGTPPPARIH